MVDLFIGVSGPRSAALQSAGIAVPQPVTVRAMIDTGASCTVIDPTSIQSLGLVPTGTVPIHTPSTAGTAIHCSQYDVMLAIYHPKFSLVVGTAPIITSDLLSQGFHALIGRDVLSRCLFIYDGAAAQFTLAF
jgi:predicted aspartyl protease